MNIEKAITHLKKQDSQLENVITKVGEFQIDLESDYFLSLVKAIIYQQLHGKAAASIFRRLEEFVNFKITPNNCSSITPETFRTLGVSRQKASYIIDLSSHFIQSPQDYHNLHDFSDEEIIKKLTVIKGIGKWTAQMFLMFTLCRLDVFPSDDLGIKNAMIKLYDLPEKPKKTELEAIAKNWAPFKTIASWYLWRSLEISS